MKVTWQSLGLKFLVLNLARGPAGLTSRSTTKLTAIYRVVYNPEKHIDTRAVKCKMSTTGSELNQSING
jgi:hypothetical protein